MKILRGNLWRAVATGLLGLLVLYPAFLHADEIRPAMLQIEEREGGWIDVTWKIPVRGDRRLALTPVLPDFFERAGPPSARRTPNGASVEYSAYRTGGQSLTGATLRIDGLATIPTDVLVRVALQDGSEHSTILRAGNSSYTIPEQATRGDVALAYWVTGTIHILEGSDHLLFLLTLLLIVSGFWPLVKTVTAFTIAHSLTLALATLGIVNIPPAPTEAVISLSILLLAVEAVRKNSGEVTVSERYPWVIAFAFGLVHGLGFAGALSEIGVRCSPERSPAGAPDVQRGRGDGSADIRRGGVTVARGREESGPADGTARIALGAVRDRRDRRVLDDTADRLVHLSATTGVSWAITSKCSASRSTGRRSRILPRPGQPRSWIGVICGGFGGQQHDPMPPAPINATRTVIVPADPARRCAVPPHPLYSA
jgi:hypothetical protein